MYGAESWIGANLKPVETIYLSAIKQLLSVRTSTPNVTCLIECNMPPLSSLLAQKQYNFLASAIEKRVNMENEEKIWRKQYSGTLAKCSKFKFNLGDHVRIPRTKKCFRKNQILLGAKRDLL